MPLIRGRPTEKRGVDNRTMSAFKHEQFDFETIEEELQVTERCGNLLQQLHHWLQEREKDPHRASDLAYCVDYFLRDYLIDFLRANVLRYRPGQVRYFAGAWYIIHTIEPDMAVLETYLDAIGAYYRYLHELGLISRQDLAGFEQEVADRDWFAARIDSFLNLTGDGYADWESGCPLHTAHPEVALP